MCDEAMNEIDVPLKSGGYLTVRARAGDREPICIGWCETEEILPEWIVELTDEECNQLCRAIRNLQGAARGRKKSGFVGGGAQLGRRGVHADAPAL